MATLIGNLECILNKGGGPRFKSVGERKIAYFLDNNSIKYHYEQAVLVTPEKDKHRIWYPDFYLPEFKTYIEYFGMAGNQNYDKAIKAKESAYAKMGFNVIAVYPWMLSKKWEGHVMKELKRNAIRPYKTLMTKPYWTRYKSNPSANTIPLRNRYRKSFSRHY